MANIVVLCGGLASRLGDECKKTPKILLKISNKRFIEILIDKYERLGFSNFYFIIGHLGGEIIKFSSVLRRKFPNLNFHYLDEGKYRLGTGGAIKKFIPHLPDNFFLTYGDSYLNVSRKEIEDLYLTKNEIGINMLIYKNKDSFDISNISLDHKTQKIIDYDKGQSSSHEYIDMGLMFFYGVKELFKEDFEERFDLSEVIKKTIHNFEIISVITKNRFYEIGSFQGISELEFYLSKGK